jgi:hypothetical protein
MNIQTLQVVVPGEKCVNDCQFCVSRARGKDNYINYIEPAIYNDYLDDLIYWTDYVNRLRFAKDNGCNTIVLTGTIEPLQNKKFIEAFLNLNFSADINFRWIELQTSGVLLTDEYLKDLRFRGVNTIALSVSDLFDSVNNANIMNIPLNLQFNLEEICGLIKSHDFNLRLSINLLDVYDLMAPEEIMDRAAKLEADQLTFKVMYASDYVNSYSEYVKEHSAGDWVEESIKEHIISNGRALETMPFGVVRYSVNGISTLIDSDCMLRENVGDFRYLVLRPNCKLYSRWDDPGSLIF